MTHPANLIVMRYMCVPTRKAPTRNATCTLFVLIHTTTHSAMSDNNSPVILLTGGSRGLGLAIANYLLTNSAAKLFVVARGAASLAALKDSYPAGRIEVLAGDLGEFGIGVAAVRKAVEVFGKLDAVVVNHGVLDPTARIEDADVEAWKTCFNINYFSAVEIVKEAIPALRVSRGRVVFVSSGAATTPYVAWGAYGGTKAAMNHFASTLGAEEKGFTSISIQPGVVGM